MVHDLLGALTLVCTCIDCVAYMGLQYNHCVLTRHPLHLLVNTLTNLEWDGIAQVLQ